MRDIIKNKKLLICIGIFLIMGLGVFSNIVKKSAATNLRKNEYEYNQVSEGESSIDGTSDVTFDAFFLRDTDSDGEAESYRGSRIEVGNSDKLYFELKVLGEVTLKDASISFESENVKVGGTVVKSAIVPSTIYSDDYNTINLKDVGNGTTSFLYLNVTPEMVKDISKYSATNKVILRGTVVDNITHEETQIEKVVNYDIDSYATKINSTIVKTIDSHQEYTAHVTYEVNVQESYAQMPMIASFINGSVSDLKGNHPTEVTVRCADNENVYFNYDPDTQTFNASKSGTVERTTVTKEPYSSTTGRNRNTKWYIDVTYPYDESVYGETVNVSVTVGNVGFSDKNFTTTVSEQQSRVISHEITLLSQTEDGFMDNSKMQIGTYLRSLEDYFVSKTPILEAYKGNMNNNATFKEIWQINAKLDEQKGYARFTETNDVAGSKNMAQYIEYKSVYVSNLTAYPKGGTIKIINDDTDEIVLVLNKDNWSQINEFPNNVHRVRVETAEGDGRERYYFSLNFEKEFDLEKIVNDIPLTTMNNAGNIRNGFNGRQVYTDNTSGPAMPHSISAVFSGTYSDVEISTDKRSYEREVSDTAIPMTVTVKPNSADMASSVWKEGYFLVKLPKEFLDIDNLTVTSGFTSTSSEKVTIGNEKFVKIITTNDKTWNSNIILKFDAIIDPKTSTVSTGFRVYAMNKDETLYRKSTQDIYDVDENGNTTEIITNASCSFSLITPNDLITGAVVREYDDKGSTTVSPLIADVNPLRGTSDATIDVFLLNNSQNQIKDINLIGKTAYVGNKYQIGTGTLGSQFDVQMVGPITVPDELQDYVHIYYSDIEEPTKDLDNADNHWSDTMTDYTNVKSYYIKFDENYIMNLKDEYTFTYPIKTPVTTENLDKVTYFTHGAYFKYIVDGSTYPSQVSGSKLGIRLARKFDLRVNLYKAFSNKKLETGRYVLTDNDGNEKIISINSLGQGYVKDIYVNKEYTLKQISAQSGYQIDKSVKTFKIANVENDELELTHSNNIRSISYEGTVLNIDLEDEVLYTVDLHNIDVETNAPLAKSIFKIQTEDDETGINIMTDSNGHAYLRDMELDKEYIVTQTRVSEYAPVQYFILKLERDPENHDIDISVRRLPQIELTDECHEKFSIIKQEGTKNIIDVETANEQYSDRNLTCKLKIGLEKFKDKYNMYGSVYIFDNRSTSYSTTLYLYDKLVESGTLPTPILRLNRGSGSYSFSSSYASLNAPNAYTPSSNTAYQQIPLQGGRDYTLEIRYNKSTSYSGNSYARMRIGQFRLVNANGESVVEIVRVDEKENVHPYYADGQENSYALFNPYLNEDVSETVVNYNPDDNELPILNVEVKNKKIDKIKFELTKINGDTNELLPGAQFKIEGPGLPQTGKIITTDENGKMEVDLQLSYDGATNLIPGLLNPNYPLSNTYKLQEVSAPSGYSIDNKPIVFQASANITYDNDIVYGFKYLNTDSGVKNKFPTTDIDSENRIFKATMKNFPSVKITKKDEETGEFLPNTYYTITEIIMLNGNEQRRPARDASGEIVGEKLTINGVEYYIIKTDENGQISLNLSSGKYELKEIQAADDKYEISDQIHYFGVGETVPYQPKGLTYVDGFKIDEAFNSGDTRTPTFIRTSDGGYLVVSYRLPSSSTDQVMPFVIKYDKNFREVWRQSTSVLRSSVNRYTYFDDPDRVTIDEYTPYETYNNSYHKLVETDTGYYVASANIIFKKLDKETGEVIYDSDDKLPNTYGAHFQALCKKDPDSDYSTWSSAYFKEGDDDHYYCAGRYFNSNNYSQYNASVYDVNKNTDESIVLMEQSGTYGPYYTEIQDDDGNTHQYETTTRYCVTLADGTQVCSTQNDINELFLIRFDTNGDAVSATPLRDQMNAKFKDYIRNYVPDLDPDVVNVSYINNYATNTKLLDDGTVIILLQASVLYEEDSYTQTTTVAVKVNPNNEVVSCTPLGFYGAPVDNYTYDDRPTAIINDDGSYIYRYSGYYNTDMSQHYSGILSKVLSTDYQRIEGLQDPDAGRNSNWYLGAIVEFDSNGRLKKIHEYERHIRELSKYDSSLDYHRIYNSYYGQNIYRVDDGYIIVSRHKKQGIDYEDTVGYDTVILKNGEEIDLAFGNTDDGYDIKGSSIIVYKLNDDDSIEWVKQFVDIYSTGSEWQNLAVKDDEISFIFNTLNNGNVITNAHTNESYSLKNASTDKQFGIATFKLSKEVLPEAPEAFILDLVNKRKEFKINVDSNEGGKFKVTNPDEETLYEGTKPGTIEIVKYGDNTENKLLITPDEGYSITNITVNNKPADFTINDDGSVVLNKIKDVKEDKNIYVTFTLGKSQVIVHHYLTGTEVQVASDELLTGTINTDYSTRPISSNLYGLAKDDNGEYIIPENYEGKFKVQNQIVTYYYDINKVLLKVNHFLIDTQTSLVPSIIKSLPYGSSYRTDPANIPLYEYAGIEGDPFGILDTDETVVNYYYKLTDTSKPAKLIVEYIDKETGEAVAEGYEEDKEIGDEYSTSPLTNIPEGYIYDSVSFAESGIIQNNRLVIKYYYTKIKPLVRTRYLDKETGLPVAPDYIQNIVYGKPYETNPLQVIPVGYEYDSVEGTTSGIAKDESIVITYYYKKAQVDVTTKYLDKANDNPIANEDVQHKEYGEEYTTNPLTDIPEGYEYDSVLGSTSGTVGTTGIEVIYYYTKIKLNVTTKYLDKANNQPVADEDVQELEYGSPYTTVALTNIPEGYEFNSVTGETSGTVGTSNIEVTYYYSKIKSDVTTKYLDKATNNPVADQDLQHKEYGEEYTTSPLTDIPEGYEYNSVTGTTSGTVGDSDIEVIYYYSKIKTDVITKYLDKANNEPIANQNVQHKEYGNPYVTSPLANIPEGYEYDSVTGEASGTVGDTNIVVTYYYTKVKSDVRSKYLDKNTNNPIANDDVQNLEYGDPYETHPLTDIPEGYEFDSVTGSTTGTVGLTGIDVIYYYTKIKLDVTSKYLDKATNEPIAVNDVQNLEYGTPYTTSPLTDIPEGYEFDSVVGNQSGTVGVTDIDVIYYYSKIKRNVTSKYLDKDTNEPIATSDVQSIEYGQEFNSTPLANIPDGYEFDSVTGTTSGTVGNNNIDVIYYYKRINVVITVRYLNIENDNEVADDTILTVHKNQTYDVSNLKKSIRGYNFDSVVGEYQGTAEEDTEVIFYYKKIKEVKPAEENPKTGDNIKSFVATFVASFSVMISLIIIKRKENIK